MPASLVGEWLAVALLGDFDIGVQRGVCGGVIQHERWRGLGYPRQ
jgi:HD-GYP domain-containing protein (c-di-GMP phosphodiesterase class II)